MATEAFGRAGPDLILAAAEAAMTAARDAEDSARAAASLTVAAQDALKSATAVAISASHAIAVAVAAAASETAEIAARAATEVEAQAASRAVDVVAKAKATLDSATTVAAAVLTAAEAVASAAETAAATVDRASGIAQETGRDVASSVAAAEAAADVAVESATVVADLTSRLRRADAVRRIGDLHRDRLVSELDSGLLRNELRLHYQPIHSMRAGTIVAVEALLRWQHPIRGLLRPRDFLDVAEGHALMDRIDDWVLSVAVAQADSWRETLGADSPDMWVNIAGDQFARPHLVGVVERLLSASGLAPGKLGLEVTERQLIRRADSGADHLMALRDLGISLAVDDFGTGYASLDYLRRFTFDEIKIDRSFIAGLGQDRTDTAVTSSIIALGRSLGLVVVAEGVETQDQYDLLKDLGCDRSQGYLLDHPTTPEVITTALLGSDGNHRTGD